MRLLPGTRLGPYEVLAPLGAGGMGEVYRAKDTRLSREVAIKVLPAAFANDAGRLRRFEQEARAASALNHPNILTIYDVGTHEGSPYVVSELLEGETLRQRMGGAALPQRKALDFALQTARGLAAAHHKGIVHRDLKPENLFVTNDGRAKILDFGLAKLTQPETVEDAAAKAAAETDTDPNTVMGTVGYTSPEQLRGLPADHRSDLFVFGAILYEMLTGRRAFRCETAVETMHAILKDDPPEIEQAPLARIVRHCLEKNPEQRFQSAHDLAFDLEALAGVSGPLTPAPASAVARPARRFHALAAFAVLAAAAIGFFAGHRAAKAPSAGTSFRRLTFRHGMIWSARFAPDGQTVLYGAAWDGRPPQVYLTRPGHPESLPLGRLDADLLSISSAGELALSLRRRFLGGFENRGTLARVHLTGDAPREMLENVQEADWTPDGASLAVVRVVDGRYRLELPPGKVLYETTGYLSHIRVSPRGDQIAFLDHPVPGDDAGAVAVVDLAGKRRTLSGGWVTALGLAWNRNGEEIWFTAFRQAIGRALYAVTLSGQERLVTREAGMLTLQDISPDGRVLMTHDQVRRGILSLAPDQPRERDLSWFDRSLAGDLSADGKALLFHEGGEGSAPGYAVYLRQTDGSPAVRLGEGVALALSPDQRWALCRQLTTPEQIFLLPTGPGEPKPIRHEGVEYRSGRWFPDGRHMLLLGNPPGERHRLRNYLLEEPNAVRPITPEGISGLLISPDGKLVAAGPAPKTALYPVEGGDPRPIPGLLPGDVLLQWSADGRALFLTQRAELPARIYLLFLSNGRRELWKELAPPDSAGIYYVYPVLVTPDGKSYAYTYRRILSDLYLVEGLR